MAARGDRTGVGLEDVVFFAIWGHDFQVGVGAPACSIHLEQVLDLFGASWGFLKLEDLEGPQRASACCIFLGGSWTRSFIYSCGTGKGSHIA